MRHEPISEKPVSVEGKRGWFPVKWNKMALEEDEDNTFILTVKNTIWIFACDGLRLQCCNHWWWFRTNDPPSLVFGSDKVVAMHCTKVWVTSRVVLPSINLGYVLCMIHLKVPIRYSKQSLNLHWLYPNVGTYVRRSCLVFENKIGSFIQIINVREFNV